MALQTKPATALAAGFQDPVHDAQANFRSIMDAMARPGTTRKLTCADLSPPEPLTASGAAIALTLFDYDTPIWLDRPLMSNEAVKSFLRFHTGAPIVTEPVDAAFALVAEPEKMPSLAAFNQGSAEYPDRSTTIILMVQLLGQGPSVELTGPGIKVKQAIACAPLPPVFWTQIQSNNAQFPRGVDLIFAGAAEVAALPRSSRINQLEG
ncbi:phosphonate C-P lyase system protein PhnH [Roseibium denhamense]|uniref:Alpha-D-ribose 1-methylphosphonate 5-triphosphate synthase subunit PhnH n=1 Tax=Roseibium denhamense TaxID=76305 RepID=A0ABY1P9E7_9HYPH|nr:phosphonate C-P lyase system protein PhnH [Roseibium denhamense]MTI07418.1 phosphonate C-P lyase system protein PhnH [Roseibium denhamense]SMP29481.1 alpha-D-ribose 1-methylphosphonate 5-triphosphate synthase subunit PhnH [Roseibium denhamense]